MMALMQSSDDGFDYENPFAKVYEHQSGGILQVLDKLQDEAEDALNNLRRNEMENQHKYDMLKQDIENESANRNKSLKQAQSNKAAAEERNSSASKSLATASKSLNEDKEYLADLKQTWETKEADHNASQKSFSDEISAIEEAVRILTQEEFTAALKRRGGSLLQMRSDEHRLTIETARAIKRLGVKFNSAELMQLAARARADPFGKVKGMISDMIEKLEKQAVEEADHKTWCDAELKANAEKIADGKDKLEKYNGRVEQYTADITTLSKQINRLQQEIADMDAAMAEATKLRQDEDKEFKTTKADCEFAISALQQAIQVLRAYYESGAGPSTKSISLSQTSAPRTFEANKGASTGIIGMLEVTESDFTKMLAESTATEEESFAAFQKLKNEYEVSKASKAAEINGKNQEIKGKTNSRNDAESDRDTTQEELDAILEYNAKVKEHCTYKIPSFKARAARRQAEIEGLKNALNILSGEQVATLKDNGKSLIQFNLRKVGRHNALIA